MALIDQPTPFDDAPLIAETKTLFRSVRAHDFDTLAALCDDDFGIIDIGPDGGSALIRTRAEWEEWFQTLFAQLGAMGAETDTEIHDYQVRVGTELAFSVVEFTQVLQVPQEDGGVRTGRFFCVVTIIWKQTPDGWREARWHVSVIRSAWDGEA